MAETKRNRGDTGGGGGGGAVDFLTATDEPSFQGHPLFYSPLPLAPSPVRTSISTLGSNTPLPTHPSLLASLARQSSSLLY